MSSQPPEPDDMPALLIEAALLLSSFQNKLRAAGYPFTAPPGVPRLIERIDGTIERITERQQAQRAARPVVKLKTWRGA